MKNRKQILYIFLGLIVLLILLNVLSDTFFLRLDFTSDKRYTLSSTTKDILHGLKKQVTVTAYFSKDMPTELQKTKRDFTELVVEYGNRSNHKVTFATIDPSGNDKEQQNAQQAGVMPVTVNVREKDQEKQQSIYLAAIVKVGDQTEVIPVIRPGAAMEYALSTAIKKLTMTGKASVGLLQGQGEPSLAGIHEVYAALDITYNVNPLYLTDTTHDLSRYKTIAIVAPKDSIKPSYLKQLDSYLSQGGNLFLALNHVQGNFQNLTGDLLNTGLEGWLKQKGITLENNFVTDANCGTVNVQQPQGFMVTMQFPYLPVITKFTPHPVTEGLEGVILQFASTITYKGSASRKFTPLAMTSDKSGTAQVPVSFNISKQWTEADFPAHNLVVAVAVQPADKSSKEGKIVLISNGNFAINGEGENTQRLEADNVNLMVNAIDWLSDDTGLINLRTKGITTYLLRPLDESTKTFLKFFNFLFPIILVLGYGFYRAHRKRALRNKRMTPQYVW